MTQTVMIAIEVTTRSLLRTVNMLTRTWYKHLVQYSLERDFHFDRSEGHNSSEGDKSVDSADGDGTLDCSCTSAERRTF